MGVQKISANLVTQGSYRFYVASMPSNVLAKTCFVVNRFEDPYLGFQRRLEEDRAKSIADYIDKSEGSIPTAIILSAQPDAELKYSSRNKTISFYEDLHAFLIIDGQHRVYGFTMSKSSIRVPVVIYEGLSREQETELFIDINTLQKPVSQSLLLDVKSFLKTETEAERQCSQIFEGFFKSTGSILKGKLSRAETSTGKISRRVFNHAVEPLLGSLGDLTSAQAYSVINDYLTCLQAVFSEIDNSAPTLVTKPIGFQAALMAFPAVLQITLLKHNHVSKEAWHDSLDVLQHSFPKSRLRRPGSSYKGLGDVLINCVNQVSLRANLIADN